MSKVRKNKKIPQAVAVNPAFKYTSVCCESPAKKPPVRRDPADITENKFSECGLGKWDCQKCGKRCKVKRSKFKEEPSNDGPIGTESAVSE